MRDSTNAYIYLPKLPRGIGKPGNIIKRNVVILRQSNHSLKRNGSFTVFILSVIGLSCTYNTRNFRLTFIRILSEVSQPCVYVHFYHLVFFENYSTNELKKLDFSSLVNYNLISSLLDYKEKQKNNGHDTRKTLA